MWGQYEIAADTLHHSLNTKQPETKQFGEYQLDMRQLNILPSTSKTIQFSKDGVLKKDFGNMFRLDTSNIFGTGFTNDFSRTNILFPYNTWSYPYGMGYGYGLGYIPLYSTWAYNLSTNPDMLQGASFRLKNGAQINVYGKYDAQGRLLPGMNAMPWQKHDFKGAFEMKSANGHFGISIEVSREANPMGF
jgi:hypothetical protein